MIIELHGANFHNKGAELMLKTTISEIKKRLPEAKFIVDPLIGDYDDRSSLDLYQFFPPRDWMGSRFHRPLFALQKGYGTLTNAIPLISRIFEIYGALGVNKVDGLVDISGFAFTSEFGDRPTSDFSKLVEYYSKRNKPVIMLPQAFGPFQTQEIERSIKNIIEGTDKIYARDEASYEHLYEIQQTADHIEKLADITLFFPNRRVSTREPDYENEILIIPNIRILRSRSSEWKDKYHNFLIEIIQKLHAEQRKVAFLIHDTSGQDINIAEQINEKLHTSLKIYDIPDPIEIKNKIATAPFIITSRYHGAIAAFSKCIPSLCMGWSHKYDELYSSFKIENFIIHPDDTIDAINTELSILNNPIKNKNCREQIKNYLVQFEKENRKMWDEVVNILKEKNNEAH